MAIYENLLTVKLMKVTSNAVRQPTLNVAVAVSATKCQW